MVFATTGLLFYKYLIFFTQKILKSYNSKFMLLMVANLGYWPT